MAKEYQAEAGNLGDVPQIDEDRLPSEGPVERRGALFWRLTAEGQDDRGWRSNGMGRSEKLTSLFHEVDLHSAN